MAIDIQDEYSEQIERGGAIMFVGSNNRTQFNEMGQEHFDYLIHKKLKPHHVFLDVGCGALRTGQYIIPYLNNKNYYGLDRMPELVEYGLNDILPQETVFEKEPKFSVNDKFNFDFVDKPVDVAWCQSLMSHLCKEDIQTCLLNVKNKMKPGGVIFFTYFQKDGMEQIESDAQKTHSKKDLYYSEQYMNQIVRSCNLETVYNGNIGHPRGQWMYICKV